MDNSKYCEKSRILQTEIKHLIFENASLVGQLLSLENENKNADNERVFLLEKLSQFENFSDDDMENNELDNNPEKNTGNKSKKKNSTLTATVSATAKRKRSQNGPGEWDTLPLKLNDLTIQSLGKVNWKNLKGHCDDTIYPLGYVSSRLYADFMNPEAKCTYTCKISQGGNKFKYARFELMHNPSGTVFEAYSSNDCHRMLLEKINSALNSNVVKVIPKGDEFFGLQHPFVIGLLQRSSSSKTLAAAADQSQKNDLMSIDEYERITEMDPTLSFRAFQSNLNFDKSN